MKGVALGLSLPPFVKRFVWLISQRVKQPAPLWSFVIDADALLKQCGQDELNFCTHSINLPHQRVRLYMYESQLKSNWVLKSCRAQRLLGYRCVYLVALSLLSLLFVVLRASPSCPGLSAHLRPHIVTLLPSQKRKIIQRQVNTRVCVCVWGGTSTPGRINEWLQLSIDPPLQVPSLDHLYNESMHYNDSSNPIYSSMDSNSFKIVSTLSKNECCLNKLTSFQ